MTAEAAAFAARTMDAIAEDRRVPVALGVSRDAYLAVRDETEALVWQLAEMPAHQLGLVIAHTYGQLNREPLRSGPTWAPQRTVYGLLLLALEQIVRRIGDDDDASLALPRPPAYAAAIAAVAAARADILADVDREALAPAPSLEEPMPDAPDWFARADVDPTA